MARVPATRASAVLNQNLITLCRTRHSRRIRHTMTLRHLRSLWVEELGVTLTFQQPSVTFNALWDIPLAIPL